MAVADVITVVREFEAGIVLVLSMCIGIMLVDTVVGWFRGLRWR